MKNRRKAANHHNGTTTLERIKTYSEPNNTPTLQRNNHWKPKNVRNTVYNSLYI